MATDLFGKYYNNPTKSYVYSNMTCNGASADEMSFDISKEAGVITNNETTLSSIDLSSVHVAMSQYTNDMKIINPFGFIYVRGVDHGEAYTRKAFGLVSAQAIEVEDWQYLTTAVFELKYLENGVKQTKKIEVSGSKDDGITFIEQIQTALDTLKVPISVEYKERYLYFTSSQLGYDFWISMIELWHWFGEGNIEDAFPGIFEAIVGTNTNQLGLGMDDGWVNPKAYNPNVPDKDIINAYTYTEHESQYRDLYDYLERRAIEDASINEGTVTGTLSSDLIGSTLFEDLTKYIPARKYRNGAMKGCVVVATYPVYNADSISDTQRSLRMGFMKDRVEDYYTSEQNSYLGFPTYVRVVKDVVDSYYAEYEEDTYRRWANEQSYIESSDGWLDPEEVPTIAQDHTPDETSTWEHSNVPNYYMLGSVYKEVAKRDVIGLYGYATYLTKTRGWHSFGQLYARTTVEDDETSGYLNLIPSFIIYNPNSFPVSVNYMTFA